MCKKINSHKSFFFKGTHIKHNQQAICQSRKIGKTIWYDIINLFPVHQKRLAFSQRTIKCSKRCQQQIISPKETAEGLVASLLKKEMKIDGTISSDTPLDLRLIWSAYAFKVSKFSK